MKGQSFEEKTRLSEQMGNREMVVLCGIGYFVSGFRYFPWLALNFHMAHNLNMNPSTLQLVQFSSFLPMVAKPLYGVLSDAVYIGGAHRLPYISFGVLLQVLPWLSMALFPVATESHLALITCILVSNLGASLTRVVNDALITEYGKKNKVSDLQSHAFMATAIGGVLGNSLAGFFLSKTQQTTPMFLFFSALLAIQLAISLRIREESLGLSRPVIKEKSIKKQYFDLFEEIKGRSIFRPMIWIISSIVAIPSLTGSIFYYQTKSLNLDPSVIGMSKVTGQLMLLSITAMYNRFGKSMSMRKLVTLVQLFYAFALLLDLVLVKQLNLKLGVPNEIFALCFSGLAETIAQFKLLPFNVLFASLAKSGCEGSLTSFLASVLWLSSITSGFLGVGVASILGITSENYSGLPLGIMVQFVAALLPLCWIVFVPVQQNMNENARKTE